jgi:diguanylate cyclase (GGDEF)-like protein/PAS domain S-box-containing protein
MELQKTSAQAAAPATVQDADGGVGKLFEMTSDLLATISLDGCFTLLNPAWEQLLGWSRDELQSRPVSEFVHPEDAEQLLGPMRAGGGHPAEVENFTTRYRHRDGSWRWLLWSARRDGETWYAAAKDVTDRVWLERQALHDPLTKLPNRTLLMDRARQAMSRLYRSPGVLAMLFIDLDKFKAVNDNLGHDVGDRLLISVSERLSELMRESDTIARLGGDEFVILAEELENEGEAVALAGRVLDALEEPFPLGTAEVAMLASVGISIAQDSETDPEAMLREADLAMYKAKGAGGRRLTMFDDSLRQAMSTQVELEALLREALPRQELMLAYQPILPLTGGQAVGIEALVRWRPQRDGVGEEMIASAFLPPAEDSELIVQIGRWVLHSALEQAER